MVVWNRFYVKLKINSNFYVFSKKNSVMKISPSTRHISRISKMKRIFEKNLDIWCFFKSYFKLFWNVFQPRMALLQAVKAIDFFSPSVFRVSFVKPLLQLFKKNLWRLFLEFNLSKCDVNSKCQTFCIFPFVCKQTSKLAFLRHEVENSHIYHII